MRKRDTYWVLETGYKVCNKVSNAIDAAKLEMPAVGGFKVCGREGDECVCPDGVVLYGEKKKGKSTHEAMFRMAGDKKTFR